MRIAAVLVLAILLGMVLLPQSCLAQGNEWAKLKPTKPGEVTVYLSNGNHFTGRLIHEDKNSIRIKMSFAEMSWDKNKAKRIIRFGEHQPAASQAGVEEAPPEPPRAPPHPAERSRGAADHHPKTATAIPPKKGGVVRIAVNASCKGVNLKAEQNPDFFGVRRLAKILLEDSPLEVFSPATGAADGVLTIEIKGTPRGGRYEGFAFGSVNGKSVTHKIAPGILYTGASVEGSMTLSIGGRAYYESFKGNAAIRPEKALGSPKHAPFGKAILRSRFLTSLATIVSDASGMDKARVLAGVLKNRPGAKEVQKRAAELLVQMGAPAASGLADAFEREDLRRGVGSVVKKIGKSAIPSFRRLLKHSDSEIRFCAARVLFEMNPEDEITMRDLVAVLVEGTTADKKERRLEVVRLLGALGPRAAAAAEALGSALADEKDIIRYDVKEALRRFGASAKGAVPSLARILMEDERWHIYTDAAEALAEIGRTDEKARAALTDALKHENRRVREAAASALEKIGSQATDAVPALAKAVTVRDGGHGYQAIQALAKLGATDAKARAALADAVLDAEDRWTRKLAADALGGLGPDAADCVPTLAKALEDSDLSVRNAAVSSLQEMGSVAKSAIPALEKLLLTQRDIQAAMALGTIGKTEKAARDALARALSHRDRGARYVAAVGLGWAGPAAADTLPVLTRVAVEDGDKAVRENAVDALGKIGVKSNEVISALSRALHDPSEAVRVDAKEALKELGVDPSAAAAIEKRSNSRR